MATSKKLPKWISTGVRKVKLKRGGTTVSTIVRVKGHYNKGPGKKK